MRPDIIALFILAEFRHSEVDTACPQRPHFDPIADSTLQQVFRLLRDNPPRTPPLLSFVALLAFVKPDIDQIVALAAG